MSLLSLEQILDSLSDGIVLLNAKRECAYLNPTAEEICGISSSKALGQRLSAFLASSKTFEETLEEVFSEKRSYTLYEERWRNRLGKEWMVEVQINPLANPAGEALGASLCFRDLTRLKEMEAKLRHQDRLTALEPIAAGLAHEIKNPLGGIRGAAQLLGREIEDRELSKLPELIIQEVDRIRDLMEELSDLARPQRLKNQSLNLNQLLDELVKLESRAEDEKQISWVREFDPSLPPLRGNPNQLKQVFLNLLKNAREAISKKGEIHLRTKVVQDYQLKVESGGLIRPVLVEIEDNGKGMSPKTLEKIFSPFYTTKPYGSGLGLAICQKIIHEHHGQIQVESRLKKGSIFRIFLRP